MGHDLREEREGGVGKLEKCSTWNMTIMYVQTDMHTQRKEFSFPGVRWIMEIGKTRKVREAMLRLAALLRLKFAG